MYKQAELIFNPEQKHIQHSKQSEYGIAASEPYYLVKCLS